jgi:hypothetical protein
MIVDLFLRTYAKDVQWLPFLFRSLCRHARGFRNLIVVTPKTSFDAVLPVVLRFKPMLLISDVVSWVTLETCNTLHGSDDYNGQQVSKLLAWEYSSADEVLYLDSDNVLIRDVGPTTRSGLIEVRPWADAGQAICWKDITEQLLGLVTPYETMCRHPFQHNVQLVRRCLEHVGGAKRLLGLPAGRHFSEFNLLGSYAHLVERQPVTLVGDPTWQPDDVRAFWSHGGVTPAVEQELRELGYWADE